MNIGEHIQTRRNELGLSMAKLGDRVGLPPQAINRYEKGEHCPSAMMLYKIAMALDCDMNYFFIEKG